jgi:formylglycine-generating enzyme required for sulfatase activity
MKKKSDVLSQTIFILSFVFFVFGTAAAGGTVNQKEDNLYPDNPNSYGAVDVLKGDNTSKEKPVCGSLNISTIPGKADVSIVAEDIETAKEATTPAEMTLPTGIYKIKISKGELYETVVFQVLIEENKKTSLENIVLPIVHYRLKITTNPRGADVRVNNRDAGRSPVFVPKIKAGKNTIRITSLEKINGQPKYLPEEKIISVNKDSSISIELTPNFRPLEIIPDPPTTTITIRSQKGETIALEEPAPVKLDLIPGQYDIIFKNEPIYEQLTKPVFIRAGKKIESLGVKLTPIKFLRDHFVRVPAGEFVMGSKDGNADESPEHRVWLPEFWIAVCEVTVGEYRKFVESVKYRKPICKKNSNWGRRNPDDLPVNCVSWKDAREYVRWLSKTNEYNLEFRLPTEAEWEKVARGTDGRVYPWGNHWQGRNANFSDLNSPEMLKCKSVDDGFALTAPVRTFENGTSPYGVYNMAGNVWEWTNSIFKPYPYNAGDGREEIDVSGERVIRGGGWDSIPEYLQTFIRSKKHPDEASGSVGFRLVVSVNRLNDTGPGKIKDGEPVKVVTR